MAKIVGKSLQFISSEVGVIPEDVVVTGSRGALDALVRDKVEVAFCGVVDALVNDGASQSVTVLVLVHVCREKSKQRKEQN